MPKGYKKKYVIYGITHDNRWKYYVDSDIGFSNIEFAKVYPDKKSALASCRALKRFYVGEDMALAKMGVEPVH